MNYPLKKSQYDLLIKQLSKCLKLGDGIMIAGDCIHPVLFKNEEDTLKTIGSTTIRSVFPFILPENVIMVSVLNFEEVLGILKPKKGIKSISLLVDDNTIRINTDGDEVILFTTNRNTNGTPFSPDYGDYNYLLGIVSKDDNDNNILTDITQKQLDAIRDSKPVKLKSESGTIRISKNLFPLAGPMPKAKPNTSFSASWSYHHVTMNDDNNKLIFEDHVLCLVVKYKELEAVHMYSVVPY